MFGVGDDRRVNKRVEVRVGDAYRIPEKTTLPIAWFASGSERLFPSLEANLELAALGERRSQRSISARYTPPLGAVGRALDRALMHRVADATVKDFVGWVVDASAPRPMCRRLSSRGRGKSGNLLPTDRRDDRVTATRRNASLPRRRGQDQQGDRRRASNWPRRRSRTMSRASCPSSRSLVAPRLLRTLARHTATPGTHG
jgi:hypothetical protein